jgi:hypothetical protein
MGNLVLHALTVYPCSKQDAPANESLERIRREERGQCPNCSIQTHEKKFISPLRGSILVPLTNEDVKKGRCLECYPPKLELVVKAEFMNEDAADDSIIYLDPSRVHPLPPPTAPPLRITQAEYVSNLLPSTEQEEKNSFNIIDDGAIKTPPELRSSDQNSEARYPFKLCDTARSTKEDDAYDEFSVYMSRLQHSLPSMSFQKVIKVEDTDTSNLSLSVEQYEYESNSTNSAPEDDSLVKVVTQAPSELCNSGHRNENTSSSHEEDFDATISIQESVSSVDNIGHSSHCNRQDTSDSSNHTPRTSGAETTVDFSSPSVEQDEKNSINTTAEDDDLIFDLIESDSHTEVSPESSHSDNIVSSLNEIVQDTSDFSVRRDIVPSNPEMKIPEPLFKQRNVKVKDNDTINLSPRPRHCAAMKLLEKTMTRSLMLTNMTQTRAVKIACRPIKIILSSQ